MISRPISGIQVPSKRRWVSRYSSTFRYPSYTVRWRLMRTSSLLFMADPGKADSVTTQYIGGLLPQDCEIRYRAIDEILFHVAGRAADQSGSTRPIADQGHRDHRRRARKRFGRGGYRDRP